MMTTINNIPSNDSIEDWLKYEPLAEEKKQELAELRKSRQDEFIKRIEEDDPWVFMSSWNTATCEGFTICLMMTQANPNCSEDFENSENSYVASTTQEYRARRKFKETFGEFYSQFVEFHTREEFFEKFKDYLPSKLFTIKNQPCAIEFHTELYYNFS